MSDPQWLVSVHDLMPEKMATIKKMVKELDEYQVSPLTLLVVPGGDWHDDDIEWLRARQARGDQLAGHGWRHQAGPPKGIYDRLHRRFFSRGVAEHLPLGENEICALIRRCHDWFTQQGLVAELYVPPAWAMGSISFDKLRELPFKRYETLSGVFDAGEKSFRRVPLLGYEADTGFRVLSLRLSNAFNQWLARFYGKLRVALHPHDLDLLLRNDLLQLLQQPAQYTDYR
ncbi:MAG: polysaccharide deacetylase family protein [Gammaproteobacteria bacterium]|nr:polysaccharide deacetylase family protein [Gammaproteobacteria bacterium]